ncbi:type II toxin-antitoxin system prevent-host-death family antitoxin [Acidiferrobacter sp. SPIII_3]|uniref:type II toxin-antitoxin system Phd/YefM family antitoxin n=1 Tax=Acidiferrobacter sp. SPIII_3 TaxID=1281578 RepID=UPI00197ABA3E
MRTVNLADAKARLSKILNDVEAGEEVIITRHGTPIARVVPARGPRIPRLPASSRRVGRANLCNRSPPSARSFRKCASPAPNSSVGCATKGTDGLPRYQLHRPACDCRGE